MVPVNAILAQYGGTQSAARNGSDIASWADTPGKLALVWIVGGIAIIAIVVLLIKMKMDKG
jgi:hypothetical protein